MASNMSQDEVKQAQQKLKSEGLYKGEVDGIAGPETKQALEEFQKQNGLQQTGSLDQETMSKLTGGGQTTGSGSSTPPASGNQSGSSGNQSHDQGSHGSDTNAGSAKQ
jgi:peptidoglycan hydrolase-like protein with peptidoglycan-binding domain